MITRPSAPPAGWFDYTLSDLFRVKHGYAFDGKYFAKAGPYVLLTPGNFYDEGGFKLKENEKYYTGEVEEEYVLRRGDLLVAMTEQAEGLLGSSAIIPESGRFLHNQRLGLITDLRADRIDKKFLYHLFNTRSVRTQIRASATGTKVRHTAPSRIGEVKVRIPDVATQEKIAAILSAYDDLISNNTRRIAVLEEMAQSLYREWFACFRFPGHEHARFVQTEQGRVPHGWELRNLFTVADVTYGYPFQSKLFKSEPEGKPLIRIRDILSHSSATFTAEEAAPKYTVTNGDILIGMDGEFHMCRWAGREALLNQRITRLRSKSELHAYHIYLAVQGPIRDFNSTIVGTTVAHLGDKHLREISILYPPEPLRKSAYDQFDPIFRMELNLRIKNQNLRRTRDLLLPKLTSGELDVEHLDIDTGEPQMEVTT